MRRIKTTTALTMTMLVLAAGTASAATLHGTNAGDALYGTNHADTMYAYGDADLAYGHGGADVLYGGNERGWGDKLLGGSSDDRVNGQGGDDAIHGEPGNDRVHGGYGNDLLSGGHGNDLLDGGPGADEVDARDGQKDIIVIRAQDFDTIYYDRGLDVLQREMSPQGSANEKSAGVGSEDAVEPGKVRLLAKKPPEGYFEHTGKVLVEHEGEELLVAEKDLGSHLGHGDEILDPTGRAEAEGGRR